MVRFALRHRYMDAVVILATMLGGSWIVRGLTDSDGFGFLWILVSSAVFTPILHYLQSRRRREWRELGIPDPALRLTAGAPIVNDYPVTPAAHRRGRIYLALRGTTSLIVVPLAVVDPGAWAGVVAALVVMIAALAGFAVFARGFRAGD